MEENVVPLDVAVVAFPGNEFKGDIAPELQRLEEEGLIRIIDLVFIIKDENGEFAMVEINDLPDDPFDQFVPLTGGLTSMLTEEDIANLAEQVPPDNSALLILWQNIWTERLRRAVKNANGVLLAHQRIPAEVLNEVMAEIAAAEEWPASEDMTTTEE
jgi:uncharacterized membrane protein